VLVLWGCNLYQVTKSAHTPERRASVALTRTCFGYNVEAAYAHTSGVYIDTNRELTIVMLILCVCADAVAAVPHRAIQVELSKAFSVFVLLRI
jgi:hypothetical protein